MKAVRISPPRPIFQLQPLVKGSESPDIHPVDATIKPTRRELINLI
jgi:hypothetical protein